MTSKIKICTYAVLWNLLNKIYNNVSLDIIIFKSNNKWIWVRNILWGLISLPLLIILVANGLEGKIIELQPQENSINELERENDEDIDTFTSKNENSKINRKDSLNVKFVINTIAFVPDSKSIPNLPKTSDEETLKLNKEDLKFEDMPYRILNPNMKIEMISTTKKLIHKIKEVNESMTYTDSQRKNSLVLEPFWNKLISTGMDKNESNKLSSLVSVSIGLNRPLSLSQERNQWLYDELSAKCSNHIEDKIKFSKVGYFWYYNWLKKTINEHQKEVWENCKFSKVKNYYDH